LGLPSDKYKKALIKDIDQAKQLQILEINKIYQEKLQVI